MYKTKKRIVKTLKAIVLLALIAALIVVLTPYVNDRRLSANLFRFAPACIVFTVVSVVLKK